MAIPEINTMDYDDLFASQVMPVVSDTLKIAQAGFLKRGSVLTSEGALVEVSEEGGADVYAVLAEDVDTTDGETEAAVYLTGEFNATALVFKEGTTVESVKPYARKVGIFIKNVI